MSSVPTGQPMRCLRSGLVRRAALGWSSCIALPTIRPAKRKTSARLRPASGPRTMYGVLTRRADVGEIGGAEDGDALPSVRPPDAIGDGSIGICGVGAVAVADGVERNAFTLSAAPSLAMDIAAAVRRQRMCGRRIATSSVACCPGVYLFYLQRARSGNGFAVISLRRKMQQQTMHSEEGVERPG